MTIQLQTTAGKNCHTENTRKNGKGMERKNTKHMKQNQAHRHQMIQNNIFLML